ncbi:hypothetical protein CF386_12220 [Paraphotobacterium marinum]|uniref:DUF2750 domain-containing protein n=1 Tax=Paraphotobacterium marinum TaxID=1755811 RepID=A0A220VHM3_9GAMM|nr:DUF2750 domain-containing protein [Paraphotobacterium marinum]ASK79801.1 hypothetical protein CF386_12220 [Paraphotobacterium marinum]
MTTLTTDLDRNLDLFVQETSETKLVWGLCSPEEEWLIIDSIQYENAEVMPFWSSEKMALEHCVEEWSDFSPQSIPLDMFLQDWMVTFTEDETLVGLNWNLNLEGEELEPEMISRLFV